MTVWKQIPELPSYEASSDGKIRSVNRTIFRGNKPWNMKSKVLKEQNHRDGYFRVKASNRLWLVHQLVLMAFVGPKVGNQQCCHNNGNPKDNRVENLRWDDPKHNVADRLVHGTHQLGSKNHRAKLTEQQAIEILLSKDRIKDIAEKYSVSPSLVCNIKSGCRWPHLVAYVN
jgi:hypothetical protein